MTEEDVRHLALALPGTEEKSHFGKADFRVRNRIFASLPGARRAVVKLTVEQQEAMSAAEPAIFAAVRGGWGRQGWTEARLETCDEVTLQSALTVAWRNVAPKRLQQDCSRP
jgi:hypothetical protein